MESNKWHLQQWRACIFSHTFHQIRNPLIRRPIPSSAFTYLIEMVQNADWLLFAFVFFISRPWIYYCYYLSSVKCTKESSSTPVESSGSCMCLAVAVHACAQFLPSIFINVNHSARCSLFAFHILRVFSRANFFFFTDGKMHVRSEHDTALEEKRTVARERILNCAPYQRLPVRRCVVVDFNS